MEGELKPKVEPAEREEELQGTEAERVGVGTAPPPDAVICRSCLIGPSVTPTEAVPSTALVSPFSETPLGQLLSGGIAVTPIHDGWAGEARGPLDANHGRDRRHQRPLRQAPLQSPALSRRLCGAH